jgi:hypothetical protein
MTDNEISLLFLIGVLIVICLTIKALSRYH